MKKLLIILAILFLAFPFLKVDAATKTASVSGNWSSTTTWGGSSVPLSTDNVIINNGINLTVDGTYTINSVTFFASTSGAAASGTLTVNSPNQLTVTTFIQAPSGKASGAYIITGTGTVNCATLNVNDTAAPSASSITTITVTSTITTLSISGNLVLNARYTAGGSKTNNPIFDLQSGTVTVGGTVTTANQNAANTSTLLMNGGAQTGTLKLTGTTPWSLSGTGTNTITLNGTSATVNYAAAGAQAVLAKAYTNLILSGSGAKSITTGTSVSGDLSIAPTGSATASIGASLNISANSLHLGGNLMTTGTWGSTSSAATHKNNTYFAATTGIVTVATGDTTPPTLTPVTPATNAYINNTTSTVSITNSETLGSGSIIATRTGGTTDGTVHTCTLVGTGLTSGLHTINFSDTTNGCTIAQTLVSGAVYSFAFSGTDLAGNASTTVTNTGITFDNVAPTVSSVAVQTALTVNITFSEAIGSGATTASNYTLTGTGKGTLASNPNSATLVSGNTYVLTWTSGLMVDAGNITITVANVQDLAGNTIGSPNSGTHTGGGIGLNHFAFATISSPQTVGVAFNVTITAQDANNNTLTNYTGTVDLTTTAGTISPATSGSFVAGVRTESVTVTGSGTGKTITATDHGGTKTGTSNTFTVNSGVLDHFAFAVIGTQTAGTAFNITITAQDSSNNTLASFVGTVNLTTNAGTISPATSGSFVAGVRTESVTVTQAGTLKTITATDHAGTGKTGTSNTFTVNAGAFAKLQLLVPGEIANPGSATGKTGTPTAQTAGSPFSVTVNAVDANWNLVSSTNTVGITSSDPLASLPSNAALVAGTKNFTVYLNTAGTATITATDITDGTKTANTSPSITVSAGTLDHFSFNTIGTQAAGTAFNITMTAQDSVGNTITSFNSTVNLTTNNSATISPTTSGSFVSGVLTQSVSITPGGTLQTITATGDGKTGTSNTFTVNNPSPTTTSISPTSKTVGDSGFNLTVYGTNFISTSVVYFSGSARTTTYVSATQLTVSILTSDLANAGIFNITVVNPAPGGGTSSAQTFTVGNPTPTTTSIYPSSKTAGDSGFTLTVHGTGFLSSSVVEFNGNIRSTTYVSSTQVTASILASDIAAAGSFLVIVNNPSPCQNNICDSTNTSQIFTVNNLIPGITNISPSSVPVGSTQFTITITGTNFVSNSQVNFGASAIATTFVSATQLTAVVPASNLTTAGTYSITVYNPSTQQTSNAQYFTVGALDRFEFDYSKTFHGSGSLRW